MNRFSKHIVVFCLAGSAAVSAMLALPAAAHHSAAMFDNGVTHTYTGEIHEFQFTNPHSWLVIDVTSIEDEEGNDVPLDGRTRWGFEAEGPTRLITIGITQDSFVPGEPVVITGHPMRDGRAGAEWLCTTKIETGEELCARGN